MAAFCSRRIFFNCLPVELRPVLRPSTRSDIMRFPRKTELPSFYLLVQDESDSNLNDHPTKATKSHFIRRCLFEIYSRLFHLE